MNLHSPNRTLLWWLAAAWCVCVVLCVRIEGERLLAAIDSPAGGLAWFSGWNAETTLPGVVLVLLPGLVWVSQHRRRRPATGRTNPEFRPDQSRRRVRLPLACALLCVATLSLMASGQIGFRSINWTGVDRIHVARFAELPPAYHDEFSYLLQAKTFRSGRWHDPAAPVLPQLFHQFHVLNEPVTASRYFPWTGLWLALFADAEWPIIGHWLAGAIAALFFTLFLSRHLPLWWATGGGILIAVSPGIAVFSNLLLAHHPTLMVLSVFLWSFDCFVASRRPSWLLVSGSALALAMLSRPMTAAGFALPYGIWLLRNSVLIRRGPREKAAAPTLVETVAPRPRPVVIRSLLLISAPLAVGFVVLAIQNDQITGSVWTSPYQLYTERYTPWHRYGFDNIRPAADELPELPHAIEAYNAWAEPLTPSLAARNVRQRILASVTWTLGIVPLLFGLLMSVPLIFGRRRSRGVRLVWLSIVSLHLVHVPYWYVGILHWHYVFETAPLLIMLATIGWYHAVTELSEFVPRKRAVAWLMSLIAASLLAGWVDADWAWGRSKVSQAVSEQSFSRVRQAQFRSLADSAAQSGPVLILVDEAGTNPQLSYIVNPPDLRGPVLVCRLPSDEASVLELKAEFPDRQLYVFDPTTFTLQRRE